MDTTAELVAFLENAEWEKRGNDTSICVDKNLKHVLVKFASGVPDLKGLKGHDLQAWKTTGSVKILDTAGYFVPVRTIEGTSRIEKGLEVTSGARPFYFEDEIVITGPLYFVLALPPKPSSH
ncbi:hypothetical protein ACMYSQ_012254 [Aspergillus niger]